MSLEGQDVSDAKELEVVSLSNVINHVQGAGAAVLTKPSGGFNSTLVLHVESGNFRVQIGDKSGTITAAAPAGSVTDGSGSLKLQETEKIAITAPKKITVIGDGGSALLTYYWI